MQTGDEALLQDDGWRLLFHGTSRAFDEFSEDWIGKGGDANSALGVHLAEWPADSAEYAEISLSCEEGSNAHVLAVLCPAQNPKIEFNYFSFFGFSDEEGQELDHAHFHRLRQSLITEGHDILDYEDGEQVICVALSPEPLKIIARLTPDEAIELDSRLRDSSDPYSGEFRLSMLKDILASREAPCFSGNNNP